MKKIYLVYTYDNDDINFKEFLLFDAWFSTKRQAEKYLKNGLKERYSAFSYGAIIESHSGEKIPQRLPLDEANYIVKYKLVKKDDLDE